MISRAHTPNRLGNIGLKILALGLGYSLWYIFSQTQVISVTVLAPLCFDTADTSRIISAPETITATLSGTRQELATIDFDTLAFHVNIDQRTPGEYAIHLGKNNLFLPEHVNLLHYESAPLVITVNDQSTINPEQQGAFE